MNTQKFITNLVLSAALVLSCNSTRAAHDDEFAIGTVSPLAVIDEYQTFDDAYQAFYLGSDELARVAKWPENIRISVYFGTWCHDSQREVPKLMRIAEASPSVKYSWVALDLNKSDPQQLAKSARVKFTPTIIVYDGEKELGRIIERPKVTLIDDITLLIEQG